VSSIFADKLEHI